MGEKKKKKRSSGDRVRIKKSTTITYPFTQSKFRHNGEISPLPAKDKLPRIHRYVIAYTTLTYRANIIVNAYIEDLLAKGEVVDHINFEKLYIAACKLMKSSAQIRTIQKIQGMFPGLLEWVQQLNVFRIMNFRYHDNSLNFAGKSYKTSVDNLSLHDESRCVAYLKAKYPNIQVNSHYKYLAKQILNENNTRLPQGLDEADCNLVVEIETDIKKESMLETRYIWKNYINSVAENNEVKSFTLLPIHKMTRRYAPIDSAILSKILIPGAQTVDMVKLANFFTVSPPKNYKETVFGRTNGYELHLVYTKWETITVWTAMEQRNHNLVNCARFLDRRKSLESIVGVDPGVHNMFTCARYDFDNDVYDRSSLTRREYNANSQTTNLNAYARELAERGGVEYEHTLNLLSRNSLKYTRTAQDLLARSQIYLTSYDSVFNVFDKRKYWKFKFYKRQCTQSEFDRVVDVVLCHGKRRAVVAMGNARNLHGFRGVGSAGPANKIIKYAMKRLKNRGFVININESYTTQSTACCHAEHSYYTQYLTNDEGEIVSKTIRGILNCKNCGITWNRDYMSSININHIARATFGEDIELDPRFVVAQFD